MLPLQSHHLQECEDTVLPAVVIRSEQPIVGSVQVLKAYLYTKQFSLQDNIRPPSFLASLPGD